MNNVLMLLKDYLIIKWSNCFDINFYQHAYPDIKRQKLNSLIHFISYGWKEDRNPSRWFNTSYYLSNNLDLQKAGLNPLTHWLLYGRFEGRNPSPFHSYSENAISQKFAIERETGIKKFFTILRRIKRQRLDPKQGLVTIYDDKRFIDQTYFQHFGKVINYKDPRTFTEKMQIYKLYYRNPSMENLSDKILIRDHISKKLGKKYLAPLIGVYENTDSIPIYSLPEQFIIKLNHGSGWNIICWDKENFSWKEARIRLNYWLTQNYYWLWREWNYKNIQPKILIEKLMVDNNGATPIDYKIHCFNGKAKMIELHIDRFITHKSIYLDLDWNILPFHKSFQPYIGYPQRPNQLISMIELAEKVAGDFPFVRIDFYLLREQPYISEMTFFPGAGFSKFHPPEWDRIIGDWFDISDFYPLQ